MAFDRSNAIEQLEIVRTVLLNLKRSCYCEFHAPAPEDARECPACDLALAVEAELFELDEIIQSVKRGKLIYS